MTIKYNIAKGSSSLARFALRHVAHTNASNMPGKIALKIDNCALKSAIRKKVRNKKIIVVGTNGKTSVTNLVADIVEESGRSVVCNRSGANMKSGIMSAVLQARAGKIGVFESDELWLKESIVDIEPDYVLLLNLFRDQLDRCGEIERIQSSIAGALKSCPNAKLVYNADDPLCTQVAKSCKNASLTFGIEQSLNLSQNSVIDTTMCQNCDHMLTYEFRQYDKLGKYECKSCGFKRPNLDWRAGDIKISKEGITLKIENDENSFKFSSKLQGVYNIYNMLACAVAGSLLDADESAIQRAFDAFNPKNGRLQKYTIDSKELLLNLAKNPTGFNQNLRIIRNSIDETKENAVAFFINDLTADGHDISWIWDVDFEELADLRNTSFYSGGIRKNDLQVRLKHAGIASTLIDDVSEILTEDVDAAYAIANYTALPEVKGSLDKIEKISGNSKGGIIVENAEAEKLEIKPLKIAHVLPELLNLYGDGGNLIILQKRCEWRGIPCKVDRLTQDKPLLLDDYDIVFLGGGPDREQKLATKILMENREELERYVEGDGVLLAICGGYQILGKTWLLAGTEVPGLELIDIATTRPGTSADRLTSNIALKCNLSDSTVVGFENHAGRTYLGEGVQPFGKTVSSTGAGNNENDMADGAVYKNTIGTYLHGPLLSKNPEIADYLIEQAILRRGDSATVKLPLATLDDSVELAAKNYMIDKIVS